MSEYIIHHHPRTEIDKLIAGAPAFTFCGEFAVLPFAENSESADVSLRRVESTPQGVLCEDCRIMYPVIMAGVNDPA